MFNVAVLRLKDITKYLVGIIFTIVIVIVATRYFSFKKKDVINNNDNNTQKSSNIISKQVQGIKTYMLKSGISQTIPAISAVTEDEKEKEKKTTNNFLENILTNEINIMRGIEENKDNNKSAEQVNDENTVTVNQNETEENKQEQQNTEIELAKTDVKTEVVTNNPIAESFNVQYGNVKIKNQTSYTLTEDMLKPDITIDNKNILMFHTHSCESYTASDLFPYTPTGNYRTTDLNYTVTRVGTELEVQLKQYGFSTYHDMSYHDYPSYNGSYTKSLQTVQTVLQTFPADIIIDLHRDAIGSRPDYAPTVKIGDDYAAQIMYVIGTNAGGLYHPNWNQNLKFAIKVQEKAEEMYPGLFKPIMLTESRYNQHTGKYASIMEVGSTGNTLEQCLNSMKYLAKVLDEVVNNS